MYQQVLSYTAAKSNMILHTPNKEKTESMLNKLRSEIVWDRLFAAPAFIRRSRSHSAVRKLFLKTSPNFSSMFRGSACFWQSPDIPRKL